EPLRAGLRPRPQPRIRCRAAAWRRAQVRGQSSRTESSACASARRSADADRDRALRVALWLPNLARGRRAPDPRIPRLVAIILRHEKAGEARRPKARIEGCAACCAQIRPECGPKDRIE